MWFFTKIADGFDRVVHEDEVFLDQWGTEAAAKSLRGDGSIELGVAAATWAGFKFSTTVAKGFVDVLRIGDGVKKGGWGYGEDALRALVLVGPALRGVRMAAGLVATVDVNASVGNCAWVAAARSLRLTGRLYAGIADVAKFAGLEVGETAGATMKDIWAPLRMMGVNAELIKPAKAASFTTMEEVFAAARQNRDGVVMFTIKWMRGTTVARHALIARWGPMGVTIIDRTGVAVKTLQELEALKPGYGAIGSAVPYGNALTIGNSIAVQAARNVTNILHLVAVEVKPAIVKPADLSRKDTPSAAAAPAKTPQPTTAKTNMGRVTVHATCIAPNSESPQVCSKYYTYQVVAGDSLSKIAQYAYKDGRRWSIIYEANKGVLGPNPHNPAALKAGMELFIPSK